MVTKLRSFRGYSPSPALSLFKAVVVNFIFAFAPSGCQLRAFENSSLFISAIKAT